MNRVLKEIQKRHKKDKDGLIMSKKTRIELLENQVKRIGWLEKRVTYLTHALEFSGGKMVTDINLQLMSDGANLCIGAEVTLGGQERCFPVFHRQLGEETDLSTVEGLRRDPKAYPVVIELVIDTTADPSVFCYYHPIKENLEPKETLSLMYQIGEENLAADKAQEIIERREIRIVLRKKPSIKVEYV